MKKYFYMVLIQVSFGAIVIEPENQIQNTMSVTGVYDLAIRAYSQTSTDNYFEGRLELDAEL